jgi:hypothetical protein
VLEMGGATGIGMLTIAPVSRDSGSMAQPLDYLYPISDDSGISVFKKAPPPLASSSP